VGLGRISAPAAVIELITVEVPEVSIPFGILSSVAGWTAATTYCADCVCDAGVTEIRDQNNQNLKGNVTRCLSQSSLLAQVAWDSAGF
jgi:hypothetical protein